MANHDIGAETLSGDAMNALVQQLQGGEPEGQPQEAIEEQVQEGVEGDVEAAEELAETEETDEAEEAAAEDETDEETGRYAVKVNGQELKVTLQELKEGYSREQDYRRKTSEIAEQRKTIEAKQAEYDGSLTALAQKLELVGAVLARQVGVDDVQLDKLAETDPAAYLRAEREMKKRQAALQAVEAELEGVRKAQMAKAEESTKAFRKAEADRLAEVMPDFRHPDTEPRLRKYLKDTYGIGDDVYDSVADHRFRILAEKARKFDAMKDKAALKDKEVKKTAKVLTGGATVNQQSQAMAKGFDALRKAPSVDALAALLRG